MCLVLFHSGTHLRGFWETLGLTGVAAVNEGWEGPPTPIHPQYRPNHVLLSRLRLGQRVPPLPLPTPVPTLHATYRFLVLGQNQASDTELIWVLRMPGPKTVLEDPDLNKIVMTSMTHVE